MIPQRDLIFSCIFFPWKERTYSKWNIITEIFQLFFDTIPLINVLSLFESVFHLFDAWVVVFTYFSLKILHHKLGLKTRKQNPVISCLFCLIDSYFFWRKIWNRTFLLNKNVNDGENNQRKIYFHVKLKRFNV